MLKPVLYNYCYVGVESLIQKKQISKMTDLCPFTGLAENVTNQSVNQIYHISHLPHDLHHGSVLVMNQR